MRLPKLTALTFLAAVIGYGQTDQRAVSQDNAPQRTTGTARPESAGGTAEAAASPNDAYVRSAVENYRRSWARMGARTQKMLLSHGGLTPDQYERNLRQRLDTAQQSGTSRQRATANAALAATAPNGGMSTGESGRQLDLDLLNTMKTYSEDLNTIRDGNLQRVQKAGCAPEVALRIAELKGRLAAQESALRGQAAVPVTAPALAEPRDKSSQQLDLVLGLDTRKTGPAQPVPAQTADAGQRRKQSETEIAATRAELDGLAGVCAPHRADAKESK